MQQAGLYWVWLLKFLLKIYLSSFVLFSVCYHETHYCYIIIKILILNVFLKISYISKDHSKGLRAKLFTSGKEVLTFGLWAKIGLFRKYWFKDNNCFTTICLEILFANYSSIFASKSWISPMIMVKLFYSIFTLAFCGNIARIQARLGSNIEPLAWL